MELVNDLLDDGTGPSEDGFVNVGSNGGLTIWYTGAANQTAHTTFTPTADVLYAYPVVLGGGIVDTIACEVTTLGALSATHVGIYRNTSDNILYPSTLLLDSGEFDTTSIGVKSTAGLSVAVAPGLYWFASIFRATVPVMRAINGGGLNHILGLPITVGTAGYSRLAVATSYGSLPTTFTAAAPASTNPSPLVAVHYAS